jgi:hypothetical protein
MAADITIQIHICIYLTHTYVHMYIQFQYFIPKCQKAALLGISGNGELRYRKVDGTNMYIVHID